MVRGTIAAVTVLSSWIGCEKRVMPQVRVPASASLGCTRRREWVGPRGAGALASSVGRFADLAIGESAITEQSAGHRTDGGDLRVISG
jgi:hypothetical protein